MKFIDTEEELKHAAEELKTDLGIDLECENNLHHYGTYLSIVQISTENKVWVVDVLSIKDLTPMINILQDDKYQKVFHDTSFDFRILKHELNCQPKNIFDTQIALELLGKKELGLGSALKDYFGIEKQCKFQMADWTKRPINKDMLEYASKDTEYLLRLRDILIRKLREKNRLSWANEEFLHIEKQGLNMKEQDFMDIKGMKSLSEKERAIAKRIINLRERIARKIDKPVHFVISNAKILEIVKGNITFEVWKNIKSVHPIVKRKAFLFYSECKKGANEKVYYHPQKGKRMSINSQQFMVKLQAARDKAAEKLGIDAYLILNKEQMIKISVNRNMRIARKWQKEIMSEYFDG